MAEAFDLHGPDINDHFGLGEAFRETGRDLYERDKGDNRDEDNGHGDTYSFGEVDTYNGPYEQTSNQDEFNFETASAPNEVEKPEEISIKTYEPMDFSFLSVDSDSEEEKDKYRNKTYATSEQMDDFFGFMKDKQVDYNNREFERKEKERKEKEIDDIRNELKNGLDSLKTNTEKSKDKRPDFEIKSAVPPSPGSGTRGKLEKDAKTSPMYAEANVSDRKKVDKLYNDWNDFLVENNLPYNSKAGLGAYYKSLGIDYDPWRSDYGARKELKEYNDEHKNDVEEPKSTKEITKNYNDRFVDKYYNDNLIEGTRPAEYKWDEIEKHRNAQPELMDIIEKHPEKADEIYNKYWDDYYAGKDPLKGDYFIEHDLNKSAPNQSTMSNALYDRNNIDETNKKSESIEKRDSLYDYEKDFIKNADDLSKIRNGTKTQYDYDKYNEIKEDWPRLKAEMKRSPGYEDEIYNDYWNGLRNGVNPLDYKNYTKYYSDDYYETDYNGIKTPVGIKKTDREILDELENKKKGLDPDMTKHIDYLVEHDLPYDLGPEYDATYRSDYDAKVYNKNAEKEEKLNQDYWQDFARDETARKAGGYLDDLEKDFMSKAYSETLRGFDEYGGALYDTYHQRNGLGENIEDMGLTPYRALDYISDWDDLKKEMQRHPGHEKEIYDKYWDDVHNNRDLHEKEGFIETDLNSNTKGDLVSKLEEASKNSPMYAEAGVPDSPRLTTDLNATPEEMEAAKKQALEPKWNDIERISKDFDFSNAKPLETKEVGWGPFKHEVLADNKISGLYTAQQMKEMDNFIRKTESKLGQNITDVANKVTAGIAPTTVDVTNKFDRQNYKSAIDQVAQDYLSKGKDVQQAIDDVNKMVENASMGLAKAGVDYYLLTGDALNKTAESVQAVENQILVSLEKGIITEEQALEAIDKAHQVTNMDQLKSLATSPALQGIEITLATAAGATLLAKAAGKIAPIVVDKLLKSNSKIGNKILEKLANNPAVKQNYKNRAFQEVFEAQKAGEQGGRVLTIDEIKRAGELQKIIVNNQKAYEKAFDDFLRKNPKSTLDDWHNYADKIPELKKFRAAQEESADLSKLIDLSKGNQPEAFTDLNKAINETKMKMAQSKLDNAVEYAISKSDDLSVNDIRSLMKALEDGTIDAALLLDASTQTIVDAIHKNEGDVAKVAAAIGAGAAAVDKASATPTGTFDESGKQIDSKDIVADYQKNPYTGEDAVTLQTREGQVTLPLHEAVIVGETEKLTPERGYTEEVKKAAEGMDVYERQPETRKAEVVDINNLPPDLPEKSFWTKAGDVVQAILGGRDTNNDRTISAQEWYESTLKPAADAVKDFFSLPDFKSKLEAIGNKVDATLYNITSSIPGVIDLKTGEVQTIDQPIKATKETINNIEDKIINALPNWTDGVKNETIKEGVADIVAGKIGNQFYGDSVAAVTLAKMAGAYTAATIGEIAHLYGKDLTNDEKGAINLVVTNAVGLPLAPVTSIVRDVQAMTGIPARARIEETFNPDEAGSIMIIPYSEGTSGRSSGTKSSYGWSSDITNADSKYSGYRERAKNTNLATDYNEGLAQEMNEAVSDMKVKIFNVYKNEPDYIRKAIDKVLKSYKEQW